MIKRFLVIILVIAIPAALFFIPVTSQIDVIIKAPFLKTYSSLLSAGSWEQWQPALRSQFLGDSSKLNSVLVGRGFKITVPGFTIQVSQTGNVFSAAEDADQKKFLSKYTIGPYKSIANTVLSVSGDVSVIDYLFNSRSSVLITQRAAEFKKYMETDSLYYGYSIVKLRVPSGTLIVTKATVPDKIKFKKANAMFASLQKFVKARNLKQVQPVIAQYLPKGADSAQVNVGLFVDRETSSLNDITFVRMPEHGNLLAIHYQGKFCSRDKAYTAMHKYFTDQQVQSAIAPFETYLNNKLPQNSSDKVNIRINFSTFL